MRFPGGLFGGHRRFQGRDLRKGPRTLEALGLDKMDRARMQQLLQEGE